MSPYCTGQSTIVSHTKMWLVTPQVNLRLRDFFRRAAERNCISKKSIEGRRKWNLSAQLTLIFHFLLVKVYPLESLFPCTARLCHPGPWWHWENQVPYLQDGIPSRSGSGQNDSMQITSVWGVGSVKN